MEKQRGELAKRLETAGILPKLSAPGSAADGPDEVFRRLPSVGQPAVRCSCEGRADSLRLDAQPAEGNGLFYRLAAAAALAVLTCLAVVGLLRGTLTETLRALAPRHRLGSGAGLVVVALAEHRRSGHRAGEHLHRRQATHDRPKTS